MINQKYSHPLDAVLDRPVAFQRAFKTITKNTVAALFLSQAWYWSKRHNQDDGWFFNTQEDWEEETGLTRFEQETARKILKRLGILEEQRKGVPARLYYRLDKERIAQLLGIQIAALPQSGNSSSGQTSDQDSGSAADINKNPETASEIKNMGDGESSTNMGADAPARAADPSPEKRIQAFPGDCREGVRLLFEIFHLLPPERPAPTEKGGEFALWINGMRGLVKLAASYQTPLPEAIELAYAHWNRAPFNLAHPAALKKTMTSALAQTSASKAQAPEPAARPLDKFKPRGTS